MNHSEFDTKTEVFSAWLLFVSLSLLIGFLYYFTVVRQPPKPILEWLYDRLVVPASVRVKAEMAWTMAKQEAAKQLEKVPPKWRLYINLNPSDDVKPLKAPLEETKPNSVNEIATDIEPSAVIIGAPLDDDEENVGRATIN